MTPTNLLSQREIDSLLASFGDRSDGRSSSLGVACDIKPYDFRRPDKFSKDHIRSLQLLHENFARIASSSLSSHLRMGVDFHLSSVEQATQDEYIQQLPNPAAIGIVSMHPMPGQLILEMSLQPSYAIIDRMLGGQGRGLQKLREATDVEITLLESLLNRLLECLKEAWSGVAKLEPRLDDVVLNPQVVQSIASGEVVILLLFEIQFLDTSGTISMCIPYSMLEPVMSRLGSQMWFSSARKESGRAEDEDILHHLESASVPVVVRLGTSTVSVRELLGLQKGNVIMLETPVEAELPVLIGQRERFLSRPGRVGRRIGVQVTRRADDDNSGQSIRRQVLSASGGEK